MLGLTYVSVQCVYLSRRVSVTATETHVCLPLFGLTICGLSCTHQQPRATIAKVPAVGAAQRDKTGKMTVSEAPLNIIRLWWMGSAVGFGTISLAIKHAWGESFITGAKQSRPALPTCFNIAVEKACFPGNQTGSLCHRNGEGGGGGGGGGGGVEQRHDSPR